MHPSPAAVLQSDDQNKLQTLRLAESNPINISPECLVLIYVEQDPDWTPGNVILKLYNGLKMERYRWKLSMG